MTTPPGRSPLVRLALLIATVGGAGHAPFAPGTVGSAVALVFYWALALAGGTGLLVLAIVVVALVGTWASGQAEVTLGCPDPGPVVVDEVLGMLVTLASVPVGWGGVLAGFILFRVFDVIKPFPVSRFERLPGGVGVMADDAMAGVYAQLVLRVLVWMEPTWLT